MLFQIRKDNGVHVLNISSPDFNLTTPITDVPWPIQIPKSNMSRGFDLRALNQTFKHLNLTYMDYNLKPIELYEFKFKNDSKASEFMLNRVRGANYSLFSLIGNASTLPDLIEFSIVEEMWRMNWKTMMLISLFVAVISYLYVRKLINNIIENALKS